MKKIGLGAWVMLAFLASGAAQACEGHKEKGTKAKAAGDTPVVAVLERRGDIVTVKAGPEGPLYSARTKSGDVIVQDVTAAELQASHPDLHRFVTRSTAGNGAIMDARVETPAK